MLKVSLRRRAILITRKSQGYCYVNIYLVPKSASKSIFMTSSYLFLNRVIDGGEPESFKSLFSAWKVKNETVGFGRQHSGGKGIAKISQSSFDATTLHEQPALAAKMKMIDDASGSKEVYKVHEFKLVEVPQQYQGSFFEHDCYVIKYSSSGPGEYILVYFWLVSIRPASSQIKFKLFIKLSIFLIIYRDLKPKMRIEVPPRYLLKNWMMKLVVAQCKFVLSKEKNLHTLLHCSEGNSRCTWGQ